MFVCGRKNNEPPFVLGKTGDEIDDNDDEDDDDWDFLVGHYILIIGRTRN